MLSSLIVLQGAEPPYSGFFLICEKIFLLGMVHVAVICSQVLWPHANLGGCPGTLRILRNGFSSDGPKERAVMESEGLILTASVHSWQVHQT